MGTTERARELREAAWQADKKLFEWNFPDGSVEWHIWHSGYKAAQDHAQAEVAARKTELVKEAADCVPTNWCDSLLTGPDAVMKGEYDCRDIEALLRAIQDRIRSLAGKAEGAKNEMDEMGGR